MCSVCKAGFGSDCNPERVCVDWQSAPTEWNRELVPTQKAWAVVSSTLLLEFEPKIVPHTWVHGVQGGVVTLEASCLVYRMVEASCLSSVSDGGVLIIIASHADRMPPKVQRCTEYDIRDTLRGFFSRDMYVVPHAGHEFMNGHGVQYV